LHKTRIRRMARLPNTGRAKFLDVRGAFAEWAARI
jgi:hypothetical protein